MPIIAKYELSAKAMRDITQQTVQEHLSIRANGYQCNDEMLVDILLKVVSENSSVEATCHDSVDVADSNMIRERLNEQFLDFGCICKERRFSLKS